MPAKINNIIEKFTPIIESLKKDYYDNVPVRTIEKKYKTCQSVLTKIIKEFNIEPRGQFALSRKIHYNTSYFNEIDSPEKAYWLGFFYADGCIGSKEDTIQMGLAAKDRNHLEKFCESINAPLDLIKKRTNVSPTGKEFPVSYISLWSKEMHAALNKHGCTPLKTFTLKAPNIKKEYYKHFTLGYFDGDGCVCDKHNRYCNIVGTLEMMKFFQEFLESEGVKTLEIKKTRNIWELKWLKKKSIKRSYDLFYEDATIFLERKKQVFERMYLDEEKKEHSFIKSQRDRARSQKEIAISLRKEGLMNWQIAERLNVPRWRIDHLFCKNCPQSLR